MKYNVDLYCCVYNEEKILPEMIKYWKYLQLRHIYIYDNMSTDNTLSILQQYPDWITIIPFDTNGEIAHYKINDIKNNAWKNSDADYVLSCDVDEVLWIKDFEKELDWMRENDITIVKGIGTQVVFEKFPEFDETKLFHEYPTARFTNDSYWFNKSILFDPKRIKETNYCLGGHTCKPEGEINESSEKHFLLHFKYLGEDFLIEKFKLYHSRQSQDSLSKGLGFQYGWEDSLIKADFTKMLNLSRPNL